MIRVSVPGKVMLAGEYGVLRGGLALSCTVEKRVSLFLETKENLNSTSQTTINLQSRYAEGNEEKLCYTFDEDDSSLKKTLLGRLVKKAKDWNLYLPGRSYDFHLQSSIPLSYGIGSSSAVSLAFFAGVLQARHSDQELISQDIRWLACRCAFIAQWIFQNGKASGYDILSQSAGGLVQCQCFQNDFSLNEKSLQEISHEKNLDSIISRLPWPQDVEIFRGYSEKLGEYLEVFVSPNTGGAPTIATINQTSLQYDPSWRDLGDALVSCLLDWILGISPSNYSTSQKKVFEITKKLRKAFSLSPNHQFEEYKHLSNIYACDQTWSFKASGAGGKDALILFGKREARMEASSYLKSKGWIELDSVFGESGLEISFCDS